MGGRKELDALHADGEPLQVSLMACLNPKDSGIIFILLNLENARVSALPQVSPALPGSMGDAGLALALTARSRHLGEFGC